MLDRIRYKNGIGEYIEFGRDGLFINTNDVRDYAYTYTTSGNSATNFSHKFAEKRVPYVIIADDEASANMIKNRISEVSEKDIRAGVPGTIMVGESYAAGYLIANKHTDYLTAKHMQLGEVTLLLLDNLWVTDKKYTFRTTEETAEASFFTDYPRGYPYGYGSTGGTDYLYNDHFTSCDFVMVIYGQVSSPTITIGGHQYSLTLSLNAGEYAEIDSKARTITKTLADGSTQNAFWTRDRQSYIFEQIPPGNHVVSWNNLFNFDITLKKERSEPRWM